VVNNQQSMTILINCKRVHCSAGGSSKKMVEFKKIEDIVFEFRAEEVRY
jgi:hypothetical protein